MINCGLGIMHLERIEYCRNCFGVKFNMAWFIDKIKCVRDYCETLNDGVMNSWCMWLCWIVIQSCDYDWISIFDVIDCMLSA